MTIISKELKYLWIEDQFDDFRPGLDVLKSELGKNNIIFNEDDENRAENLVAAENLITNRSITNYLPDLILLDLMLPQDPEDQKQGRVNLDGGYIIWYKIRKMKKWINLSEVPILIISARGRPVYREQCVQDPRTKWLSKPANPTQLAEAIFEILSQNS